VSCQTIALVSGAPVRGSQTRLVSRWLAIPTAATWSVPMPAWASARGAIHSTFRQISAASCSTQPGRGKYCRCSRCTTETSRPLWSNTMHRVDVVPWSMETT
jgi:hypothetical protein